MSDELGPREVRPGRWTADVEGDFVVFLIGARLEWRHPLRSLGDLGGRRGMTAMLQELSQRPEKGLLGFQTFGLTTTVQYWRSYDDLERFARDAEDLHLPVWRRFWKRVGKEPRTGIWHETFLVRAGQYEAIYGNMPPVGLGKAGSLVRLGAGSTSRNRIRSATPGAPRR